MNFVTGLAVSTDWKDESYNFILVIVNRLIKMVYYESVKVTIDAPELAKVIFDVLVWQYGLSNSIIFNKASWFIFKF